MSEQYLNYGKADFLEDASFIAYVNGTSPAAMAFWGRWKAGRPANLEEMLSAETTLKLLLSARRISPTSDRAGVVWNRILGDVRQYDLQLRIRRRRMYASAAAAILLLLVATGWWHLRTGNRNYQTRYGQTMALVLPDHSQVTLNAGSHLKYAKVWPKDGPREVWLDGEAYFDVTHLKQDTLPLKPSERFIVHTQSMDVEVLGTTFNIKDRRGMTQVGLYSGAVILRSLITQQSMQLIPGEVASMNQQTGQLQRVSEDVSTIISWKDHQLVMNKMKVSDIIQLLEDNYGYHIQVEDSTILNKQIQGVIPVKNEGNILFVLSGILQINIERKDSLIIFKQRN
ncbi:ferric-dicitrate binding protein FerR (iron transport regulator) [Chitinophaga dinghuensis]|uniref:Ferric-dicitrate binding protein FerR (Iron transport regulator) n=1 Tax=Chitinophaga dinghuensis TaxID=1539050 RepID=A0A327VSR5_9BACT|nr:FecR domain-containing protein [Chitinophaga dinghuensis]RAJ79091.1 ferric-dicitrate binding protein FerR (iron transport regulator) [Chitinophaga dinghuensis]